MVSFDTCGEERKEGAASGKMNKEQSELRQILQKFSTNEDFKLVSQAETNLGELARVIVRQLFKDKPTVVTQFVCVSGDEKDRNNTHFILSEMM